MAFTTDIPYDKVYLGAWVDQSKGSIKGAQITVTPTGAAVVVAFLALFVQYSGQKLWEILCFSWYQIRLSHKPKTALQYQQDVSLRNNASPSQSFSYLIQIAWSWRQHHRTGWNSKWWNIAILPTTMPLLFLVLLITAGILSAYIVQNSDVTILINGDNCGIWQVPTRESLSAHHNNFIVESARYIRKTHEFSRQYADSCYNKTDASRSSACQKFTQPSLPYTSTLDADCPFNITTCVYSNANLRMDTAQLDSNNVFGVNYKTNNIRFREVVTCAPLKPDMYLRRRNFTLDLHGQKIPHYKISWAWGDLTELPIDTVETVSTIEANELSYYTMTYVHMSFVKKGTLILTHDSVYGRWLMDSRLRHPDQSGFQPRSEYNVSNGDTFLLFLRGNKVEFAQPCDDPWFSAHVRFDNASSSTQMVYRSDHLANPLGCIEQVR